MNPHRLQVKYFVNEPDAVDVPRLIPVFHRWIQERRVDELLIDVVDYKHVHEGPGIMLIGHEADYGLDLGRGRPGLVYRRKRLLAGTLRDALRLALRQVLQGCHLLEADPTPGDVFAFRTDEVEVTFLDRLQVPNQPETLARVRGDVEAVLAEVYTGAAVHLDWIDDDPRQPLGLHARIPGAADLGALLAHLHLESA